MKDFRVTVSIERNRSRLSCHANPCLERVLIEDDYGRRSLGSSPLDVITGDDNFFNDFIFVCNRITRLCMSRYGGTKKDETDN